MFENLGENELGEVIQELWRIQEDRDDMTSEERVKYIAWVLRGLLLDIVHGRISNN